MKKRKLYGGVLLILCAFILFSTPYFAKASNNYISNIVFTSGGDGYLHLKFFVNTSFSRKGLYGYIFDGNLNAGALMLCEQSETQSIYHTTATFTAGQTYDLILTSNDYYCDPAHYISATGYTTSDYIEYLGAYTNADSWRDNTFDPIWKDTERYFFVEYPTLEITYPLDQAEISTAFEIEGSYTIPAGSDLNKLEAYFGYSENEETKFYSLYQDISPTSGDVEIRVAGLPIGEYVLGFAFINTQDPNDWYNPAIFLDISILADIPVELPDGETPPIVFDVLDPDDYYSANSDYASSTLLFDNLSGAIKPIILTIGENLTFFSSKFEQSKAKETGEEIASGVLIVRSYANNLNSFFNDLPISQALFFYMLLLVVVAVFRIIKNLINLIKP